MGPTREDWVVGRRRKKTFEWTGPDPGGMAVEWEEALRGWVAVGECPPSWKGRASKGETGVRPPRDRRSREGSLLSPEG